VSRILKSAFLGISLFLFLFVVLGGGLHLNPAGALLAATTGTPLIIHAFNCWNGGTPVNPRHTLSGDPPSISGVTQGPPLLRSGLLDNHSLPQ
jgi:hypothetical protein